MRDGSPIGKVGATGILVVIMTGALGHMSVVLGGGMGWLGTAVSMGLLGGLVAIGVLGIVIAELAGGGKSAKETRMSIIIIVAVHLMLLLMLSAGLVANKQALIKLPPFDLQEFRVAKPEMLAIAQQPVATPDQHIRLDQAIGVYHVDVYAVDSRGGVYFRTQSRPDYVDTISGGFCLNPNPRGSPFGAAWYRTIPIEDGWYWFEVSDDWH